MRLGGRLCIDVYCVGLVGLGWVWFRVLRKRYNGSFCTIVSVRNSFLHPRLDQYS